MTRRTLLATGMAAVAGPAFAAKRIDRSRISAISDEISRSPADAIAFAHQYKLQWLELRNVPAERAGKEYFTLPEADLKQAAREFHDAGIRISFLNTSMLKYALPGTEPAKPGQRWDTSRFEHYKDELRQSLDAAHILGVDKVRVFAFLRAANRDAVLPRIKDIINEVADIAGKEKVHILLENESTCNVATGAELGEMARHLTSRWSGLNWDPDNAATFGEKPFPEGYELLPAKRIENVQIKANNVLPGAPRWLDWAAIFRRLEKDGYEGEIGLETHLPGPALIQKSHDSMKEILRIVES